MSPGHHFSDADREDLRRRGIQEREVERQLELLGDPPNPIELSRPCVRGDGITVLDADRAEEAEIAWERSSPKLSAVKFVPASGAASRMFSFAASVLSEEYAADRATLARAAEADDPNARGVLELIENLENLPFFEDLKRAAGRQGLATPTLAERPAELLGLILGESNLDLTSRPKALIPFHGYRNSSRTAFEEHFHEAAGYLPSGGAPTLHFTVAPEHLDSFRASAETAAAAAQAATGADVSFEFSMQDPATDTVALTEEGLPLRSPDGRLVFRPAGHGALLANLGRLEADVVFIKNIDNIAPAHRHAETGVWKRRLAGHLIALRDQSWELLGRLEGAVPGAIEEALSFCRLHLALALDTDAEDAEQITRRLIDRLDRPLRVCGMVRNVGEPGGGPFWVPESRGETGQIVETSQIDRESAPQRAILQAASHFNPVDLVCALRDRKGRPFDLERFADPAASFVATKSHQRRTIRALERPGLWNGAMAGWNTAFVDVPLTTFTPVKTVLDLLRPEHQPDR